MHVIQDFSLDPTLKSNDMKSLDNFSEAELEKVLLDWESRMEGFRRDPKKTCIVQLHSQTVDKHKDKTKAEKERRSKDNQRFLKK